MAYCFPNGHIGELRTRAHAPQHQAAATHVSATDELSGKEKPFTKDLEQRLYVLRCGNAAQEDDLTPSSGQLR